MFMSDYMDANPKSKKKKKHDKEKTAAVPIKPRRNLQIIDDDIDLNSLRTNEETDALEDMLDPECRPQFADFTVYEKPKAVQNVQMFTNNKWTKVDVFEDEDGDFTVSQSKESSSEVTSFKKKRNDSDDDLDVVRRKPTKNDDNEENEGSDNDAVPRKREEKHRSQSRDRSPVRKSKEVDSTKFRERRKTQAEEMKKIKSEEKLAKYMEWGKGLVQVKERDNKIKSDVYEADKPLARYQNDDDLENSLKAQDRKDDPMEEYMRKLNRTDGTDNGKDIELGANLVIRQRYKGPLPPPNRYNIMPGARWDGVDRSNGFEKKYYDSLQKKKILKEDAYKWSVEDM